MLPPPTSLVPLPPAGRRLSGAAVASLALALASCTTVTPLQTASPVDPGITRLGVQLSATPYCSLSLLPLARCSQIPLGFPAPEVRASGRYGVAEGLDLGASVHVSGVYPRGVQGGLFADAKKQVWTSPAGNDRRHLVSLSAGAGFTTVQVGIFGNAPRASQSQLDLPVAAWYGYQLPGWELVASPRFVERVGFDDFNGDGRSEALGTGWVGLTASAITLGRSHLGLSLDYLTPTGDLGSGLFTASVGGLWDLGGE